jgi:hypothetical protein
MIQLLGVIDVTKHYRDVVFFDHSRQRIPQLSESHRERWDVDHPILTCSWLITRRTRLFKQSAFASLAQPKTTNGRAGVEKSAWIRTMPVTPRRSVAAWSVQACDMGRNRDKAENAPAKLGGDDVSGDVVDSDDPAHDCAGRANCMLQVVGHRENLCGRIVRSCANTLNRSGWANDSVCCWRQDTSMQRHQFQEKLITWAVSTSLTPASAPFPSPRPNPNPNPSTSPSSGTTGSSASLNNRPGSLRRAPRGQCRRSTPWTLR